MEKWQVIALLIVGLGLLIAAVYLRAKYGDNFEIKPIDLVLIILPLLIVLLVSGKLKVLDAFGVKADFSELFADAAKTDINRQIIDTRQLNVSEIVETPEMATKGGVRDIPKLLDKKTEALVFQLGHGGYYGPAIKEYIIKLYASSYLKYFIILDQEGKLFGIYDVKIITVHLFSERSQAYDEFAKLLNRPTDDSLKKLAQLPGFISKKQAVDKTMSKRDVLVRMDALHVDSLPVVNDRGSFLGTVERSQLTASLILDVVEKLDTKEDNN